VLFFGAFICNRVAFFRRRQEVLTLLAALHSLLANRVQPFETWKKHWTPYRADLKEVKMEHLIKSIKRL
jgi:hypothetical protein